MMEITKEEAEAYLAELTDYELESGEIKNIAGGSPSHFCPDAKGHQWGD